MSLVDYASSDDDVSEEEDKENKENVPAPMDPQSVVPSYRQPENTAYSSAPSVELPDASQLFDSSEFSPSMMSGGYHGSCVGTESASRKRETNSFASSIPRSSKVPRGNLPHSRNVPDTLGGMLVPPQLSGRSNVVTEDVTKLFVKKPAGGSPQ